MLQVNLTAILAPSQCPYFFGIIVCNYGLWAVEFVRGAFHGATEIARSRSVLFYLVYGTCHTYSI
jgi:hypothetical protein